MDRTYIDSHHIIARYLADQLSVDERRSFEEYWTANPGIIRDIEAAAGIKVGLSTLAATKQLSSALKSPSVNSSRRYFALAASIVVVAIGTVLWFGRSTQPQVLAASLSQLQAQSGKQLALADSYSILRTRSTAYDAEIPLPQDARAIEMRILPEAEATPPRYRVVLSRIADDNSLSEVATIDQLAPGEDGFVGLYFESSNLAPGRYRLTIAGNADTSGADQISSFRIRLLPATP